jgi:GH24 family phage-related lysozyme (muramidase)
MKYAGDNDSNEFVFIPPITLESLKLNSNSASVVNQNNTTVSFNSIQQFSGNDRFKYTKSKEGLELKPYPDSDSFSIGYGHLLKNDLKKGFLIIGDEKLIMSDVMSKGITEAQAETLFNQDAKIRENEIARNLPQYSDLNNNQKAAIFSYYYNTGHLPRNIGQFIAESNHIAAADSIKNGISTVKGQPYNPLLVRRAEEAELYKFKL